MARSSVKPSWVKSIFKTLEEAHEAAKFMDLCPTEIQVVEQSQGQGQSRGQGTGTGTGTGTGIRCFTLANGTVVGQRVDDGSNRQHPVYEKAPTRSERAKKQRTARARRKAAPKREEVRMIAGPWHRNQSFRNFQDVVDHYNSLPGMNRAEFDVVLLVTYGGTDETYFKMTEQGLRCKFLHYPLYPLHQ